ncbi:MAG: hypothetical protein ACRESO_08805, partial [Gammaproteobacteria bacterium]
NLQRPELAVLRVSIQRAVKDILAWPGTAEKSGRDALEAGARRFAFSLARTYTAALLAEAAQGGYVSSEVLQRWCRVPLNLI